jgi:hypothetical protein
MLGVWIPLDPVSEANGRLAVVARSHCFDARPHLVKEGIDFGALAAEGIEDSAELHGQAVCPEL